MRASCDIVHFAGNDRDVGNTLILQALLRPTLHCSSHSQFHFVQVAIRNPLAVMNFSNNESSRTQIPNAGLSNWCSRRPTRSTSAYGLKHKVHTVSPLLSTRSSTSLRVVEPDSVSLRLVLQEFPQSGTVAPSPMPRLRASCGCKPPSCFETKLWSVPENASGRVDNSQHRWPCDAMCAARS